MTRRGETLELAVLGLLHDSPMHGYELRKQLTGVLGWGRVLSYGSLYPALKRMSRAGWITERLPEVRPGASRRPRIVYELTPDGSDRFDKLMADVKGAGLTANMDVIVVDLRQIVEIQFFDSTLRGLTLVLQKG